MKKQILSLLLLPLLAAACGQRSGGVEDNWQSYSDLSESPLQAGAQRRFCENADYKALALHGIQMASPAGQLKLRFTLDRHGIPTYELRHGDMPAVLPSKLGFTFRGAKINPEKTWKKREKQYAKPVDMQRGFELKDVQTSSFDETWQTVWGEESSIRNNYNEMAVTLEKNGIQMIIRFRLYDDGLGFRYEFPEQENLVDFVIVDELTEFAMTGDHTAFWIPGDYDTQEYKYHTSRMSEIAPLAKKMTITNASIQTFSAGGVQTALQLKTDDGLYINIHEAEVVNYPTMNLDLKGRTFRTHLTPDAEGWGALLQAGSRTPWRTVQVVDDARKVLSSRLILNLNEPCALEDVSWIHPTKYMGVWWEMIVGSSRWSYTDDYKVIRIGETDYEHAKPHGEHGANNANVHRFIDYASANGFDAVLVEGWNIGWENWFGHQKDRVFDFVTPYPDFDLPALNAYAHSKGIRLIMHHETSSSTLNYERCIPEAYALMNKYGYDAVKTGYVGDILPIGEHHYSQSTINHYNYVIRRAAEHKIMVNAHEAVRPTGLCRTWPNMIGNESARGGEFCCGVPPEHLTILPFTRLQGGPMDYTPGVLEMDLHLMTPKRQDVLYFTVCKQLALYLTMPSPLQMACDLPEHYENYKDAFQFIKDVAVDWEQSKYLYAEPGDYIVVARQARKSTLELAAKGVAALADGKKDYVNGASRFCLTDVNGKPDATKDIWFVGGITDEESRSFDITFEYLKPGAKYEATIYADAPDADGVNVSQETGSAPCARYIISKQVVDASTVLPITMAPSGGFAISLKEI